MRAGIWSVDRLPVIMAALALLLVGCDKRTAIWIVPGSNATTLEFALGRRLGDEEPGVVNYVDVIPCHKEAGDQRVWAIARDFDAIPELKTTRVRYGAANEGFVELLHATPLLPGCYVARTDGTGATSFEITTSGAVRTAPARP
jgi:hypothetical protein